MSYCYGSFEVLPDVHTQGVCGSADPHGWHDFNAGTWICPGAPAGVEADCGHAGPHEDHLYAKGDTR